MHYQDCLLSWENKPTVKGKVVVIEDFDDIDKKHHDALRVLYRQLDELDLKSFPDAEVGDYSDDDDLEERVELALDNDDCFVYLYIVDGKLAGICSADFWANNRRKVYRAWVNDVSVLPEYEGQGVATELLNAVMKGKDNYEFSLRVHGHNDRAFGVYQRLGYESTMTSMVRFPKKK